MAYDEISMLFVGDMSYGDSSFSQGYGVKSEIIKRGENYLFENVKDIFKGHDLIFGNLETVLSDHGLEKNKLHTVEMRGPKGISRILKEVGFNFINIANNHALQHGKQAFYDTINNLKIQGIKCVGIKEGNEWHCSPVYLERQGQRIGLLGYSFERDKYYDGDPHYAYGEFQLIERDIKRIRPLVDFLIVSCHWGLEFMVKPSITTIHFARTMVDLGADIIIGHHAHVVQGIERYKGKIIAYSLGNFIFDMLWKKKYTESVILIIKICSDRKMKYGIIPITIEKNYMPCRSGENESRIFNDENNRRSKEIEMLRMRDYESYNLNYYEDYNKRERENKYYSYKYFIHNFRKYEKRYLVQQIIRTLKNNFG